jgi:two-component system chemotaxis response regulator CheB
VEKAGFPSSKKVGVLVVDDSPICRELICQALARDPDLEILGTCGNGREAVEAARQLRPQVITMDLEMPVMDGLAAVETIMAEVPTPILVLTSDPRYQAPTATCKALELGALALRIKPEVETPEAWNLAREVKLLSSVKVIRHLRGSHRAPLTMPARTPNPISGTDSSLGIVAIGSSTGGPQVIHKLFSELPEDFPAPIVVVQHINPAFAESLSGWLNSTSRLKVKLAQDGDPLVPGQVLIAPPDKHLVVESRGRVALLSGQPRDGHVPSASWLIETAGRVYKERALGVLLTGMGADGAEGIYQLKRAGGRTLIQSKESCVVFGMPGAALATGAVDMIVHDTDLALVLTRLARGMSPPADRVM